MASWYVYSAAAGTASGADWTNAKTTLAAAITAGAAGDTYYIADDHAESATTTTETLKGTSAAPDRIVCVRRSGGSVPPVSADLRATGAITCTSGGLFITGVGYIYGVKLTGFTFTELGFSTAASALRLEACAVKNAKTASAGKILIGGGQTNGATDYYEMVNTTFEVAHTGTTIGLNSGTMLWRNTASAIAGATLPTTLFADPAQSKDATFEVVLDGVDLSALGSGKTLVSPWVSNGAIRFIDCKLGASVTVASTPGSAGGTVVDVLNSDSSGTGYRQERYAYQATLTSETTIVRSGGASDGTQALTHKIVTTANANWYFPFESFETLIWNDTTGASKTLTVETVTDNVTLKNDDCWIEAQVLDSSSVPLGALYSSGKADVLAAGANNTTSSATWTTTGLGTPVKQSMSVTFTPQTKGYIRVIVKVAKASTTVYVDPLLTVA